MPWKIESDNPLVKECKDCGEKRDLAEFYRHKNGCLYSRCKACHYVRTQRNRALRIDVIRLQERQRYAADPGRQRDKKRWLKYGIKRSEFDALLEAQGHVCPICLDAFAPDSAIDWMAPAVDHDHATGAIRGILHRRCNLALEFMLTEDESRRARAYLEGETDARRTA
jgi:hypothetical protein